VAAEKFAKMFRFLKSAACRRVRTTNHVERLDCKLRYEEKSRYKGQEDCKVLISGLSRRICGRGNGL
jgi:hypothetical protein